MKTHHIGIRATHTKWTIALVCLAVCASITGSAQTPSSSTTASGSVEGALTIEDPTERIAALQKILKTDGSSEQKQRAREALVASWAQLADNTLGENNLERAMENFRRAIGALPERVTDRFYEDTVIRIPYALSVRGYRNNAVELARLLENRFSKEAPRLGALGEFYLTVEAADDAIHVLEMATKLDGEDARLHRLLGGAFRMGLRLDEAVAEYQLATDFDAADKRAYYELANLYRAHGAYADAIKLYRKQLEIEPKHSSSYKGMALAYLAQGNEEQMAAALNQARDLRGSAEEITGDIYLQTQIAFQYLAQNKLKQARQAADAALSVEPRYSWARIAAAEIDMATGKYFEAERNLLAARAYANFPTLYFTLGKLYLAVEDFDGALEQFSKAFSYSPEKQFTAKLGGVFNAQADNVKDLLAREHQAAIFLAVPPTSDETFKIIDSLVRFNVNLNKVKTQTAPAAHPGPKGSTSGAAAQRKRMEELDRAAMDFIEVENTRRSFRMLYIAGQLAQAGVATGLAVELADQALGLAEVATEPDGSIRDYPNYDRAGRLSIFRGRALSSKGWALYKANKNQEAAAALTESVKAYGSVPEGKSALWRLATVKESEGELKEALDLYVAGYETPAAGSEIDVNRAVIESVYRKVNGSLEGLNRRLGVPDAAPSPTAGELSVAKNSAKTGAKNEVKTGAKANLTGAKNNSGADKTEPPAKSGAQDQLAKSGSKPRGAALAPPKQAATPAKLEIVPEESRPQKTGLSDQPEQAPTAANSDTANESTAAERPVTAPAGPVVKPVELPATGAVESSIPFSPSIEIDLEALGSAFNNLKRPAINTEEPPPPPGPAVHTRKRRVTTPDNQ